MSGKLQASLSLLFFIAVAVVVLVVPMEGTTVPNALGDRANPLEFLTETFGTVPVAIGFVLIGVISFFQLNTRTR